MTIRLNDTSHTARVEDNRDGRTRLLCSASRSISTSRRQHGYAPLHEFFAEHCQPAVIATSALCPRKRTFIGTTLEDPRLLRGHWHHVAIEIGNDPHRAGDDEKDDQHAKGEGENIIRAVGPAAQMQEEDEVDADLR